MRTRRVEADDFRSHVWNKKNKRWTWMLLKETAVLQSHGMTADGRIKAAPACWRRRRFLFFLRRVFILTTGKAARKYIPPSKHVIGKADTWRIERRNLNFRTHIKRLSRRTICFSKKKKFIAMSSTCI
ncbi:MAG: IS1 family transposase [Candidatus Electronema sp. V4]|uniref:IS1 family transposase n=1 Tax=Candidatus Electronema sp. V4 TaxID=3454756 RepID=UPI0040554A9E